MFAWIKKNIGTLEVTFEVFAKRSVQSITASLSRTITSLEAHAAEQRAHAQQKLADASRLIKEQVEHADEAQKAVKVAQNIKALLG